MIRSGAHIRDTWYLCWEHRGKLSEKIRFDEHQDIVQREATSLRHYCAELSVGDAEREGTYIIR
jgi:hypothetical protein